jgi:hypothetical protein
LTLKQILKNSWTSGERGAPPAMIALIFPPSAICKKNHNQTSFDIKLLKRISDANIVEAA